jgi:hypothetical protein
MHKIEETRTKGKVNGKHPALSLTLLPLSLSDLCRETALNGLDGTPTTAAITRDETETVFSLAEFGIRRFARLADDVVDDVTPQNAISPRSIISLKISEGMVTYFSICFAWKRPLITSRREPSTLPLVPNSANKNDVT